MAARRHHSAAKGSGSGRARAGVLASLCPHRLCPPRRMTKAESAAPLRKRRQATKTTTVARCSRRVKKVRSDGAAASKSAVVPTRAHGGRTTALSQSSSDGSIRSVSLEVCSSPAPLQKKLTTRFCPTRANLITKTPSPERLRQHVPTEQVKFDAEDANWQFNILYFHLRQSEEDYVPLAPCNERVDLEQERVRRSMINAIVNGHYTLEGRENTLYLAVALFDACLTARPRPQRPHLWAAAALLVATKFEEEIVPDLDGLAEAVGDNFIHGYELVKAELDLLHLIDFRLHRPTPAHHLTWFVAALTSHGLSSKEQVKLRQMSNYICELGLLCASAAHWAPSLHAAAAALLAAAVLRKSSDLSRDLEALCADDSDRRQELRVILREFCALLSDETHHGCTIYNKYALEEFEQISKEARSLAIGHGTESQ